MKRLVCALLLLGTLAGEASAHVVYDRRTLRQWTEQARLIVVVEVRSPLRVWTAEDGSDHQEYFSVRVVETLAGASPAEALDVFAHAEGEPRFRVGDTMMLFLDRTAEHSEFAALASRFPYFTTQGAGQEWTFVREDPTVPAIARAWRDLRGRPESHAARRKLLIRQLESDDSRLQADALVELLRLRQSPEFTADPEGRDRLVQMTSAGDLSISQRVALIKILDGTEGFSAAHALLALADADVDPRERITIIRACGFVRDPVITAWLREQLRAPDVELKLAALTAAGSGMHPDLSKQVARLALDPNPRLARAAVGALSAIDTPEATESLRRAATGTGGAAGLAAIELRRRTREE